MFSDQGYIKDKRKWIASTRPMTYGERWLRVLFSLNKGAQYRTLRRLAYGLPQGLEERVPVDVENQNTEAERVALSRLRQKGFVENKGHMWRITKQGSEWIQKRIRMPKPPAKIDKSKRKNLIISFDIPERLKEERRWLREELRGLGFEMLHKSVWFGPAPLPEETIEAVRTNDLLKYLKFFQAASADII